jgi:hypothetical protein
VKRKPTLNKPGLTVTAVRVEATAYYPLTEERRLLCSETFVAPHQDSTLMLREALARIERMTGARFPKGGAK